MKLDQMQIKEEVKEEIGGKLHKNSNFSSCASLPDTLQIHSSLEIEKDEGKEI